MEVNAASLAQALSAYKKATGVGDSTGTQSQQAGSAKEDFKKMLETATSKVEGAEQQTLQSLSDGGVDVAEVVTAVSEAELMVQTVSTVRDKVIEAYQEILRMPI